MTDITAASKLVFFKTEKYDFLQENTFDTSNCPRPQFCLGLVLAGHGSYHDCIENEDIEVEVGDLIFVPIGSRYISHWRGEPHISYVSMHFIFDYPAIFTKSKSFKLQKLTPADFAATKALFLHALENFKGSEAARLSVLGGFYTLLGDLLPQLKTAKTRELDARVYRAVSYVEEHYKEELSVEMLATAANMSVSRFFPLFRRAMGLSPVEYINHYRINRAVILLMSSDRYSVEEVSEATGFQSSAYFRRVFKRITGKSPRDYRVTSTEI